jgi:hypothetical protein
MIRYSGCFAPNFKDRNFIVKKAPRNQGKEDSCKRDVPENVKQERLRWAEMLKRVFEIDVTVCPKCSGRMEQIAVIKDKAVAKKYLKAWVRLLLFVL